MPHVNWLDGVILIILALSMVTGLVRGFIKEAVALCVWILAIWFALHDFGLVTSWVARYSHDHTVQIILAVLVIIIATVILASVINGILSFILRSAGLSGTDRLLGMIFGFVRGVFIVSLLLLLCQNTSFSPVKAYSQQLMLYPYFTPIVNWLSGFTPAVIQQMKVIDEQQDNKKGR